MLQTTMMVLLVACGGATRVRTAPDLASLRASLEPHAAMQFGATAVERGCPADQTLGDYVAMLVDNGTPPAGSTDVHRLTATCGPFPTQPAPIDPPADPAFWFCRLDAYALDAASGDPWHYELRVRVRKSDGAVDLTTLGCPGAS